MNDELKSKKLLVIIKNIISTVLNIDIEVTLWNEWSYNSIIWVTVDRNTLLKNRWKYTLSELFTVIWFSLFTEKPEDYIFNLTKLKQKEHNFALMELNKLRVQEIMMYNYPWTRDFFNYAFQQDLKTFNKTENHLVYLNEATKLFFGIELSKDNKEVYKWLKSTKKWLLKMFNSQTFNEMMIIFDSEVKETYFKLLEDKVKQEKKEEWESKNQTNQVQIIEVEKEEEQSEINKELDDIIWEEKQLKKRDCNLKSYNELYQEIFPLINRFIKKLWNIIKDNNYNRFWGNFRSWKLNTTKLYKVCLNENKLFTRKTWRQHKDYMVSLLIDSSWSMHWGKDLLALKSAILLSEVLDNIGIPFEIIGFNYEYREYKTISQKYDTKAKWKLFLSIKNDSWNGWNNDWYAIRKANYSLKIKSNPTTERIILVLSDWRPTPWWEIPEIDQKLFKLKYSEEFDLVREVIKASKDSKIIGIGIQDNSVSQFYKDYIVVNNIELLPEILLNKLKTNIKRW